MPAAVSPRFRKIYNLIISPLRFDDQESSASEINDFKTKIANLILRLTETPRKWEMPDFIEFVLNSPGFKLMPYPKFLQDVLK